MKVTAGFGSIQPWQLWWQECCLVLSVQADEESPEPAGSKAAIDKNNTRKENSIILIILATSCCFQLPASLWHLWDPCLSLATTRQNVSINLHKCRIYPTSDSLEINDLNSQVLSWVVCMVSGVVSNLSFVLPSIRRMSYSLDKSCTINWLWNMDFWSWLTKSSYVDFKISKQRVPLYQESHLFTNKWDVRSWKLGTWI